MISALLLANVALTALLFAFVAGRKIRRDRREARSEAQRGELRAAMLRGGNELDALFTRARRDRALQLDLAVILPSLLRTDEAWVVDCARRAAERTGLAAILAHHLRSRRPDRRGTAAVLIGQLRLDDGTSLVRPLLDDPDGDVRLVAIGALAHLRCGQAANALVDALVAARIPRERLIERLGDRWASPVVRSRLAAADGDPELRTSLARALGLAGDPACEGVLLMLLATGDVEERVSAARSLATCGREASYDALLRAMDDPAWQVRAQAATALGALGVPGAAPVLERNLGHQAWWVRANAGSALAELGSEGERALERAAAGGDRYAAERAVEALAISRRRNRAAAMAA